MSFSATHWSGVNCKKFFNGERAEGGEEEGEKPLSAAPLDSALHRACRPGGSRSLGWSGSTPSLSTGEPVSGGWLCLSPHCLLLHLPSPRCPLSAGNQAAEPGERSPPASLSLQPGVKSFLDCEAAEVPLCLLSHLCPPLIKPVHGIPRNLDKT